VRDAIVDEATAIEHARQGDTRAFTWLIGRYKHMVFTVCSRVLRHREEAEEATQDVFVKAYRNLGSYQGGSRFSTWLYSIAYRTALSKLRSRRAGTLGMDELLAHGSEPSQAPEGDHIDRKALVDWALAQLPAEDSAIMTFFYLEELGIDEIVTITGLGESNVKVKLHRGRKKLLTILQDHLKEETWTLHVD
jgi:RNA polymerase sigma-70 factor (ECF subfamily)